MIIVYVLLILCFTITILFSMWLDFKRDKIRGDVLKADIFKSEATQYYLDYLNNKAKVGKDK